MDKKIFLDKIKLNQLSKDELKQRAMNALRGGDTDCKCKCTCECLCRCLPQLVESIGSTTAGDTIGVTKRDVEGLALGLDNKKCLEKCTCPDCDDYDGDDYDGYGG